MSNAGAAASSNAERQARRQWPRNREPNLLAALGAVENPAENGSPTTFEPVVCATEAPLSGCEIERNQNTGSELTDAFGRIEWFAGNFEEVIK
jgi:hypothetical protein